MTPCGFVPAEIVGVALTDRAPSAPTLNWETVLAKALAT
jgi:hypothetical protein